MSKCDLVFIFFFAGEIESLKKRAIISCIKFSQTQFNELDIKKKRNNKIGDVCNNGKMKEEKIFFINLDK